MATNSHSLYLVFPLWILIDVPVFLLATPTMPPDGVVLYVEPDWVSVPDPPAPTPRPALGPGPMPPALPVPVVPCGPPARVLRYNI